MPEMISNFMAIFRWSTFESCRRVMDYSGYGPSHWETVLQSNGIFYWLAHIKKLIVLHWFIRTAVKSQIYIYIYIYIHTYNNHIERGRGREGERGVPFQLTAVTPQNPWISLVFNVMTAKLRLPSLTIFISKLTKSLWKLKLQANEYVWC